MAEHKLLTSHFGTDGLQSLRVSERLGGYQGLRVALQSTPEKIIEEVKTSGLRGRGGAGFPTGMKWSFLPKGVHPRYLCVNADEFEPGCFKDRALIDNDPHQLIEGTLIAAYAIQAPIAFIYIRGEYHDQRLLLERCVEEARAAGYIGKGILGSDFSCDVIVHGGAGAYICGEETALINSLEGRRGQPRLKPPFPAVKGLYGQPTVVNNVETLSNLPHIVQRGGAWFAGMGPEGSSGTRLFCCSGHINRPGTYEMLLGTPIRELLDEECGGVWQGRSLKAFQPGGGSMQVLLPRHLDLPLDMNAVQKAGSSLGAGAMVFMDETTCMVDVSMRLVDFYHHEFLWQVRSLPGGHLLRVRSHAPAGGGGAHPPRARHAGRHLRQHGRQVLLPVGGHRHVVRHVRVPGLPRRVRGALRRGRLPRRRATRAAGGRLDER